MINRTQFLKPYHPALPAQLKEKGGWHVYKTDAAGNVVRDEFTENEPNNE